MATLPPTDMGHFWLHLLCNFRINIRIDIYLFLSKDRKIDLQKIRSFCPLYSGRQHEFHATY